MQKVVPTALPTRQNAKNHDMSDFQAQNPENSRFLSAQKADKSLRVLGWALCPERMLGHSSLYPVLFIIRGLKAYTIYATNWKSAHFAYQNGVRAKRARRQFEQRAKRAARTSPSFFYKMIVSQK